MKSTYSRIRPFLPIVALIALAATLYFTWGSNDTFTPTPPGMLRQADFGEKWPLTVAEGQIECRNATKSGFGEVVFTANGTTYAVNGIAMQTDRYADIKAIWRDDPSVQGLKIDISPVLNRGLELCK
jgi:hypothetical protein